jgi:hypothetical protein
MPGPRCEHGRQKAFCPDCGGSQICPHERQKAHCRDCNNFVCTVEGCDDGLRRFSSMRALLNHTRSRHGDDPRARTRTNELKLHELLQRHEIPFSYQHFLPFAGCGLESETKHAYLDFLITCEWGYTILECDEHAHRHYDPSCDVRRDFDTAAAVALGSGQKLRIVRFNPDTFKVDGRFRRVSWAARCERLLSVLRRPAPAGPLERVFLFYDESKGLPAVAAHWCDAVKEISVLG